MRVSLQGGREPYIYRVLWSDYVELSVSWWSGVWIGSPRLTQLFVPAARSSELGPSDSAWQHQKKAKHAPTRAAA
jgi:hypothetical protein